MAESHSEDAPLLGASNDQTDPSAPCSPAPKSPTPCWVPTPQPDTFQSASHVRTHARTHARTQPRNQAPTPPAPIPPLLERLVVPGGPQELEVQGAKSMQSQTSMDSGCDCDLTDLAGDGTTSPPTSGSNIHNNISNIPQNRGGPRIDLQGELSPLSPLLQGLSEPSSPPGVHGILTSPSSSSSSSSSTCVAPLAQRESLDCQCGAIEHKCVCDSGVGRNGSCSTLLGGVRPSTLVPPVVIGGHTVAPSPTLCHTDRGELHNSSSRVTFRIEGYDDADDSPDERSSVVGVNVSSSFADCLSPVGSEPGDDFKDMVRGASRSFPRVTSYSKTGMLSSSSSTASMPMCRICHLPQGDDMLISPCRCRGTMQFIHENCLMKWLEISHKKYKRAAICELCNYQFNRHKKFRLHHWQLPSCSRLDKILHSVFLACLLIMGGCATITVYCFKQDRFQGRPKEDTDLTQSEIVTLTCGVLFFVAFFLAMYVEVKAKDTLFRLFNSFLYLNQTWHIDEYDKRRDRQLYAPV